MNEFLKTKAIAGKLKDDVRFLKTWADKPLKTGAVVPSSTALAARMASFVNPMRPGIVLELGPGTGVVTKAILKRGISPDRLAAIEYDEDFCTLLKNRYPGVGVIHGDAYDLHPTLTSNGIENVSAIVSSLPLLNQKKKARGNLLNQALSVLGPGAPFIQFSYSLTPPVRERNPLVNVECSNWIIRNVPPARVWVYRKLDDSALIR